MIFQEDDPVGDAVLLISHCSPVLVAPAKKVVWLGGMSFEMLVIHERCFLDSCLAQEEFKVNIQVKFQLRWWQSPYLIALLPFRLVLSLFHDKLVSSDLLLRSHLGSHL